VKSLSTRESCGGGGIRRSRGSRAWNYYLRKIKILIIIIIIIITYSSPGDEREGDDNVAGGLLSTTNVASFLDKGW